MSFPPLIPYSSVGQGRSFDVVLLPPDRVVKVARKDRPHDAQYECNILEMLGPHPRIVQYFSAHVAYTETVRLAYHPRGCLRQVLSSIYEADHITGRLRRCWAIQIAEGLAFMHSRGVVHGDVNASNVLVTMGYDVVLSDFAGSCLDGETAASPCFDLRHFRPRAPDEQDRRFVQDDVFAFGSLLFEMHTGSKPFAHKRDYEVEKLYREGVFADVSFLPGPIAAVINRCWAGGYTSMDGILHDLFSCLFMSLAKSDSAILLVMSFVDSMGARVDVGTAKTLYYAYSKRHFAAIVDVSFDAQEDTDTMYWKSVPLVGRVEMWFNGRGSYFSSEQLGGQA